MFPPRLVILKPSSTGQGPGPKTSEFFKVTTVTLAGAPVMRSGHARSTVMPMLYSVSLTSCMPIVMQRLINGVERLRMLQSDMMAYSWRPPCPTVNF